MPLLQLEQDPWRRWLSLIFKYAALSDTSLPEQTIGTLLKPRHFHLGPRGTSTKGRGVNSLLPGWPAPATTPRKNNLGPTTEIGGPDARCPLCTGPFGARMAIQANAPYLCRMFKAFEFCLPTAGTKVPAGAERLHEIKYDGFRIRIERDGDRVRLITHRSRQGGVRLMFDRRLGLRK